MSREISLAEVKKHNSDKSCWLVIHNNVYDVTKFLSEHPGGEASLLDYAGKDGTIAFEDVGHSDDAKNMMKKYKLGKLPDAEAAASSSASCCRSPRPRIKNTSSRCESCYSSTSQPLRISPSIPSCARKPITEGKPWRTFDNETELRPRPRHIPCKAKCKKAARERRRQLKLMHRYKTIEKRSTKLRERPRSRTSYPNEEEGGGYNLKWALVALAAALIAGVILKKSLAS